MTAVAVVIVRPAGTKIVELVLEVALVTATGASVVFDTVSTLGLVLVRVVKLDNGQVVV